VRLEDLLVRDDDVRELTFGHGPRVLNRFGYI